jgi:hypothetical protein
MALKQPADFCEFYFHAALQLHVAERALGRIAAPRLEHLDHAHDYGYIHNGERNACAKSMIQVNRCTHATCARTDVCPRRSPNAEVDKMLRAVAVEHQHAV